MTPLDSGSDRKLKSVASSRREWLKTLGLASAGLAGLRLLQPANSAAATENPRSGGKRALRVAHITDVHVQPERGARDGFVKCLHHLQSQADAPALIVNTGDSIMDSMHTGAPRAKLQWDLWKKVLKDECSLPIEHAIGNHDCWGIDRAKSGTTGDETLWGKKWAMDSLGLDKPWRSFERGGWRFIVLDSIEPFQNSYQARLGEEQMDWLKRELTATPRGKPILVMSHIPILSPGAIINSAKETEEHDLLVGGGLMHLDSREIHTLFRKHGGVKLCLSGHLHIIDRAEYDGITYISSGAVSSGWWKRVQLDRFDYGYALVDLYEGGSFEYQYVPYGWKTVSAPLKNSSGQKAERVTGG